MTTSKLMERGFWTLLSAMAMILSWVGLNIADRVEAMSDSVIELNSTMKNVVLQIDENKAKLDLNIKKIHDLDKRLFMIERK